MIYQKITASLKGIVGIAALLAVTSAFAFQNFDSDGSETAAEIITASADESHGTDMTTATAETTPETPKTAWEWYYQGYQQLRDGRAKDAVASFNSALEIKPDHIRSMINMGRAYLTLGQFDDAETVVRKAIATDSSNSRAYHVLGRVLQSRDQTEDAITAYETSLQLDGNNPWTRNNLGLIQILQGNYDVAVELLEGAVEARDTVPYFFNNLGMAYEGIGDFEKARDAFSQALELDMDNTKAATNLARVRKHLGEEITTDVSVESGTDDDALLAPTSDENEWDTPSYAPTESGSESAFETSGSEPTAIDYTLNRENENHRSKAIMMGVAFLGLAIALAVAIAVRSKRRYGYSA